MAGHHGSERLGEQGRGLGVTELDKGCSHREMNQRPVSYQHWMHQGINEEKQDLSLLSTACNQPWFARENQMVNTDNVHTALYTVASEQSYPVFNRKPAPGTTTAPLASGRYLVGQSSLRVWLSQLTSSMAGSQGWR
jgi:hypothetical protein